MAYGKFTSEKVSRAVDNAAARLGEQLLKLSCTLIGNMDGQKFEKHNPSTVGYLTVQNSPLSMVTNDVAAQSALMLLPHSRLAS